MRYLHINSRADLDALKDTQEYFDFLEHLRGSMTRKVNVAAYPDDYNREGYEGPEIEPVWMEVEDLSVVERYGFKKDELLKLLPDA